MAEIVNKYLIKLPACSLIGLRYTDANRVDGAFAHVWGEWFSSGRFKELEALKPLAATEGAYLGYCDSEGGGFEYWVGMLFGTDTETPEGFERKEMPQGEWAAVWLKGNPRNGELYGPDAYKMTFAEAASMPGREVKADMCVEWYACPRFTEPDENGNVILDYLFRTRFRN